MRRDNEEAGLVRPAPHPSSANFESESAQPSIFAQNIQRYTALPSSFQQQSVHALEPPAAYCVTTSFDTAMSVGDRSSAPIRTKLNDTPKNEQHLQYSAYNQGTQGMPQNTMQDQYQQNYLAASGIGTLNSSNQQYQRSLYIQQEMEGTWEADSVKAGGSTELMMVQLSETQWSRVKEQSTALYIKAVKSYEVSMKVHHASRESHDRYIRLSHCWKTLTGDV
jgi:hypothetical protein